MNMPPKCQLVQCACVRSREVHTEAEKGEPWLPQRAGLCYGQFTNVQLDTKGQGRKSEEELRLKKNTQLSTTLLTSGLTDKMGEQDSKWRPWRVILQSEEDTCCPSLSSGSWWQSLIGMLKGGFPGAVRQVKRRTLWWLTEKYTKHPNYLTPKTKQQQKINTTPASGRAPGQEAFMMRE